MNKLYIYGCSHSAGNLLGYAHTSAESATNIKDNIRFMETSYTKWLGRIGNPFFENLSNDLNLDWVLRAEGGHSNQQQFKRLLGDLHKIQKDDVILFQFTHWIRFEVPIKQNGKWISDGWQKGGDLVFEDQKYQNFYLTHLYFEVPFIVQTIKQILTLLKYIETNIGAKVYMWAMDEITEELDEYTNLSGYSNLINFEIDGQSYKYLAGVTNSIDRNEHLIIKHETKGAVDDMHFGQLGHNFMYENILRFIK